MTEFLGYTVEREGCERVMAFKEHGQSLLSHSRYIFFLLAIKKFPLADSVPEKLPLKREKRCP